MGSSMQDGSRLGLWFRPVCGRAFAGKFDAEDLKTLEICGTCQIPEAKGWVGWMDRMGVTCDMAVVAMSLD